MSLSNLYASARRSLMAYQSATNITGQNIANAESVGYTRRSARIVADPRVDGGVFFHNPAVGVVGGSGLAGIDRVRSTILDDAARRGMSGRDGAGTGAQLLAGLEGQLAPDGGTALLGSLSNFWNAWSDVANTPSDLAARTTLLSQAGTVASQLRGAADRLQGYGASVQDSLAVSVESVNDLLGQIAALNGTVRTSASQGAPDLDAQDRRDLLIDELAGLVPVSVRSQADGTVSVSFGGMVGVQGTEARPLRLVGPPDTATAEVRTAGSDRPLTLSGSDGGVLGAQLHVLTVALPSARSALDTLAAQLVERVNAAHMAGTGLDGSTGQPFFDPAGTTASSLALASGLTAEGVAAGSGAPGDGGTATTIAALGVGVQTLATALLAEAGTRVREATALAGANAAVADHASALRDSVSKVSLDEEMIQLIRYQQAYAASARVLDTANGLFDTLLAL